MSSANKFVEDFSRTLSGAMGVVGGMKDEAEGAFRNWFDKMIADRGMVTREEFEAVAEMARNARAEVAALREELERAKILSAAKTGATQKANASKSKKPKSKSGPEK